MTETMLVNLIAIAASKSFSEVRDRLEHDEIIGYSILSHDTANSCCPVIATRKGQEQRADISASDFLFSPVDWNVFPNDSHFDDVNDEIEKAYNAGDDEIDDEWHQKFRELIFNACVGGLEKMIGDGFFGPPMNRDKLFVLFSLSDSDTLRTHVPGWAKRLNTPVVHDHFMTWYRRSYPDA